MLQMVGIDGVVPFATASHTFVGVNKERVCVDIEGTTSRKKWNPETMERMKEGSLIYKENEEGVLKPHSILAVEHVSESCGKLYNLVTSDHTFIVNHFAVSDDFPEVERHPRVSFRILHLLADLAVQERTECTEDDIVRVCKMELTDSRVTEQHMQQCMQLMRTHPSFQEIAETLWAVDFDRLNA